MGLRRTEDLQARPSGDRHEAGPARPGERNTSFHPYSSLNAPEFYYPNNAHTSTDATELHG